jgi:hypothetical protein
MTVLGIAWPMIAEGAPGRSSCRRASCPLPVRLQVPVARYSDYRGLPALRWSHGATRPSALATGSRRHVGHPRGPLQDGESLNCRCPARRQGAQRAVRNPGLRLGLDGDHDRLWPRQPHDDPLAAPHAVRPYGRVWAPPHGHSLPHVSDSDEAERDGEQPGVLLRMIIPCRAWQMLTLAGASSGRAISRGDYCHDVE